MKIKRSKQGKVMKEFLQWALGDGEKFAKTLDTRLFLML
jgi:hypothetical protein